LTMERVQGPEGTIQGAEVPSLAPHAQGEVAAPLEQLANTARSTPGKAGREALQALHDALSTLAPTGQNAATLVRLIDEGAFHELRGDGGGLTRELAVETLLALGFPWALQIHPDELAWYRQSLFLQRRNKRLLLLGVAGIGSIAGAIAEIFLPRLF